MKGEACLRWAKLGQKKTSKLTPNSNNNEEARTRK